MKTKYIFLIVITAIITTIIVQNNDLVFVKVLWTEFEISKLILFGSFFLVGLFVGLFIRRSSKKADEEEKQFNQLTAEDEEFLSE